jgi:hypothetical protein
MQGSSMQGSSQGSGSGSDMAGSGSAMAGSGSGSDMAGSGSAGDQPMQHHAGHCPSTVFTSETKAEVKGNDIIVTVSSKDKDAIQSIQKRADKLLKDHAVNPGKGEKHDQKGTHGGGVGMCPVFVPDGGKATIKNTANGVVVTITPKDKPADVKSQIDDRIKKSAQWVKDNIKPGDKGNQGGVGGGSGDNNSMHEGSGDAKGKDRKGGGGKGGGKGTGGGGGGGNGGGSGASKND